MSAEATEERVELFALISDEADANAVLSELGRLAGATS
jgi:hypothetical protein